LHLAAQQLNAGAVVRLIRRGAQVDLRDKNDETPLMLAATQGGDDPVVFAGRSGAIPDFSGFVNPARVAVTDETGTLQALLAAGADVNAHDNQGRTVLMKAAAAASGSTVQTLLKAGAKVNARDWAGQTPLIHAANQMVLTEEMGKRQYTSPKSIQLLLAAGADPHLMDQDGETALSRAEERGEIKLIAALRKAGGKGLRDALAGVPEAELFYAVRTRNIPTAKRLLQRGARLAVRDRQGHSPLLYAAADLYSDYDLLECLLQNSSDLKEALEMRDPRGLSVLFPHSSGNMDQIKVGDAISNPALDNKVRDLLFYMADNGRLAVLKKAGINVGQQAEAK
jgi:ankyrin repeat protein